MTPSADPPGYRREAKLRGRLEELYAEIEQLHSILPSVNDPILHEHSQALAEAAARVVNTYRNGAYSGAGVANDLASLMAVARAIRVSPQDPDLGRTQTLERLRTAKGLIVSALQDALDAARDLGLYPHEASLRQELPIEVSRIGYQALFQGITRRLDEVVRRLDELANVEAEPTGFPQQTGLLNFYIGAMRVEADLTRLHLTVGQETIDFGALARSIEVISELTRDFVATVRAWIGRVSAPVTHIAGEVHDRVRRLVAGTRTAAKWIARKSPSIELSFDPSDPECVAQVLVYSPSPRRTVSHATSVRAKVSSRSSMTLEGVTAYITEIERLKASGEWERSDTSDIQVVWTGTDTATTDILGSAVQYVNVIHISHIDNKLGVWQRELPSSLEKFLDDLTTYRFTVSVVAQNVRRKTRIEVRWEGGWETLELRPVP